MIDWKDTGLRHPNSLSVLHRNSVARREMEGGNILQRSRATKDFESAKITFRLNYEDYRIFKGVWKHQLKQGIEWMMMDLPIGGLDLLTNSKMRFTSDYAYTYVHHGLADISVDIEFFEVETISEGDLAMIIGAIEPTVPYTTEGVAMLFAQESGLNAYIRVGTTTSAHTAVSSTDPTEQTQSALVVPTFPITSDGSMLVRVDSWSCANTSDSTPAGLLTVLQTSTPASAANLVNVDLRKAPSLSQISLNVPAQMASFAGTLGSADRTFDLHSLARLSRVNVSYAPLITTVNISHPKAGAVESLYLNIQHMYGLTNLNLSGWCNEIHIKHLTAFAGNLDLSNIEMDTLVHRVEIEDMETLTGVTLCTGQMLAILCLSGVGLLSTVTNAGTDTIKASELLFGATAIDVDSLTEIIDALVDPTDPSNPFATTTIRFGGTPAATNITSTEIDAAATKNITLAY